MKALRFLGAVDAKLEIHVKRPDGEPSTHSIDITHINDEASLLRRHAKYSVETTVEHDATAVEHGQLDDVDLNEMEAEIDIHLQLEDSISIHGSRPMMMPDAITLHEDGGYSVAEDVEEY